MRTQPLAQTRAVPARHGEARACHPAPRVLTQPRALSPSGVPRARASALAPHAPRSESRKRECRRTHSLDVSFLKRSTPACPVVVRDTQRGRGRLCPHAWPAQHVMQRRSWDCGLACSLMALRGAGYCPDFAFPALPDLEAAVGTSSVWTIDLAFLLRDQGVRPRMFTVTVGVDPSYDRLPFYSTLPHDHDRVSARFRDAAALGVSVEKVRATQLHALMARSWCAWRLTHSLAALAVVAGAAGPHCGRRLLGHCARGCPPPAHLELPLVPCARRQQLHWSLHPALRLLPRRVCVPRPSACGAGWRCGRRPRARLRRVWASDADVPAVWRPQRCAPSLWRHWMRRGAALGRTRT